MPRPGLALQTNTISRDDRGCGSKSVSRHQDVRVTWWWHMVAPPARATPREVLLLHSLLMSLSFWPACAHRRNLGCDEGKAMLVMLMLAGEEML